MTARVYLDHNASAPLRPAAREAVLAALDATGNASSAHGEGRRARALLEEARTAVAELAGCAPRRVIFTSGGTEANNLALGGVRAARVLVSAVEHPSVLEAAPGATRIPVGANGQVDLAALERLLDEGAHDGPELVSVMVANNETGVLQPVREIVTLARRRCALVHCDAVQAAGRIALDELGADLMTLSGHKLGAPQGVGALVLADHVTPEAVLRGGGQEFGLRAGTQALPAIAGFGAAVRDACHDDQAAIGRLRDELEAAMVTAVDGARVIGAEAPRIANTVSLAHPALDSETLVMGFDLEGVAVSAGSACSSGKVGPSHVLEAMGLGPLARRTIRLSLGPTTTAADTARALEAWRTIDRRTAAPASAA